LSHRMNQQVQTNLAMNVLFAILITYQDSKVKHRARIKYMNALIVHKIIINLKESKLT